MMITKIKTLISIVIHIYVYLHMYRGERKCLRVAFRGWCTSVGTSDVFAEDNFLENPCPGFMTTMRKYAGIV